VPPCGPPSRIPETPAGRLVRLPIMRDVFFLAVLAFSSYFPRSPNSRQAFGAARLRWAILALFFLRNCCSLLPFTACRSVTTSTETGAIWPAQSAFSHLSGSFLRGFSFFLVVLHGRFSGPAIDCPTDTVVPSKNFFFLGTYRDQPHQNRSLIGSRVFPGQSVTWPSSLRWPHVSEIFMGN